MPSDPKAPLLAEKAMGYFQSQNYTKEQLISRLQRTKPADLPTAPTSGAPNNTLGPLIKNLTIFISIIIQVQKKRKNAGVLLGINSVVVFP